MMSFTGPFNLQGKVAVVTGAGRGLGRAIAVTLAGAGARTVLVARSAEQLAETAAEIQQMGRESLVLPRDVTAAAAAEETMDSTVRHFGQVDILVVSAGTAVTRSALEVTEPEWDLVLNVNLKSAFFWSQAAGRRMAQGAGGRIIHLASIIGQVGVSSLAPYCASKGGVIALTKSLAVEWAPLGITVNAIAPGYVLTALNADLLANGRILNRITGRTPMHRLGDPTEVAAAALFLASDAASFITGHVLAVDGGWLAS